MGHEGHRQVWTCPPWRGAGTTQLIAPVEPTRGNSRALLPWWDQDGTDKLLGDYASDGPSEPKGHTGTFALAI
jgi:hypothetical protein